MSRGLPPPDPRSLCPLSSTEFVDPSPEQNSWVRHWGAALPLPSYIVQSQVIAHDGNELADKLAKEAAGKDIISYNRIPICEIAQQLGETSLKKWQMQWEKTTKAHTTKEFFPNIKDRLNTKIMLTPNFTAFVTSHGKTKPYLHRFKIIESPDCPCGGWGGGSQTVDHLLFDCTILQEVS